MAASGGGFTQPHIGAQRPEETGRPAMHASRSVIRNAQAVMSTFPGLDALSSQREKLSALEGSAPPHPARNTTSPTITPAFVRIPACIAQRQSFPSTGGATHVDNTSQIAGRTAGRSIRLAGHACGPLPANRTCTVRQPHHFQQHGLRSDGLLRERSGKPRMRWNPGTYNEDRGGTAGCGAGNPDAVRHVRGSRRRGMRPGTAHLEYLLCGSLLSSIPMLRQHRTKRGAMPLLTRRERKGRTERNRADSGQPGTDGALGGDLPHCRHGSSPLFPSRPESIAPARAAFPANGSSYHPCTHSGHGMRITPAVFRCQCTPERDPAAPIGTPRVAGDDCGCFLDHWLPTTDCCQLPPAPPRL